MSRSNSTHVYFCKVHHTRIFHSYFFVYELIYFVQHTGTSITCWNDTSRFRLRRTHKFVAELSERLTRRAHRAKCDVVRMVQEQSNCIDGIKYRYGSHNMRTKPPLTVINTKATCMMLCMAILLLLSPTMVTSHSDCGTRHDEITATATRENNVAAEIKLFGCPISYVVCSKLTYMCCDCVRFACFCDSKEFVPLYICNVSFISLKR
jgi:hypothetical protein